MAELEARGLHSCRGLGAILYGLGDSHRGLKDYENAEQYYRRSLAEEEHGDEHGRINHHHQSLTYAGIAMCHFDTRRFPQAIPWFDRAIEEGLKGDHLGHVQRVALAVIYRDLGRCYLGMGKGENTLSAAEGVLLCALRQCDLDDTSYLVVSGTVLFHLGLCNSARERYRPALDYFQRATEQMERTPDVDLTNLRNSYNMVGKCLDRLRRHKEAKQAYARGSAIKV